MRTWQYGDQIEAVLTGEDITMRTHDSWYAGFLLLHNKLPQT